VIFGDTAAGVRSVGGKTDCDGDGNEFWGAEKGMISFVESQVNFKNETYYEKYWRDKT